MILKTCLVWGTQVLSPQKCATGSQLVIHQRSSTCSISCISVNPLHQQIILRSRRKSNLRKVIYKDNTHHHVVDVKPLLGVKGETNIRNKSVETLSLEVILSYSNFAKYLMASKIQVGGIYL
jgi:hypothetical protein